MEVLIAFVTYLGIAGLGGFVGFILTRLSNTHNAELARHEIRTALDDEYSQTFALARIYVERMAMAHHHINEIDKLLNRLDEMVHMTAVEATRDVIRRHFGALEELLQTPVRLDSDQANFFVVETHVMEQLIRNWRLHQLEFQKSAKLSPIAASAMLAFRLCAESLEAATYRNHEYLQHPEGLGEIYALIQSVGVSPGGTPRPARHLRPVDEE